MGIASTLQKVYPYAPVWVQNAGISLYGLAYKRERLGGTFQHATRQFRERESWTKDHLNEYVRQRLGKVLVHAYRNSPFYRDRWTRLGIGVGDLLRMTPGSLSELPLTTKEDFRSQGGRMVVDAPPPHLCRYQSSGSTGTPVTVVCTPEAHQQFIAVREARSFGWAGTTIQGSRSMIGGRLVVPGPHARPPFHRYNWAERQVYFSAYHIAPETATDYVAAMNRYRPALLTGYAYSHYLLATLMREQGLRLDYEPAAMVLGSEKLTPEMKQVLGEAFRTRAWEEYGAVENCALATECEHGSLHVSSDFGIVEIVDDHGRPAAPGQTGRIVCTGLINEVQPLIRYAIGDAGSWSARPCSCGRDQFPVLAEITGRTEDVIYGRQGQRMVRFHGVFTAIRGLREAQLIQEEPDRIRVLVVPTFDFGDTERQEIVTRVRRQLGDVHVVVEAVSDIQRGKNGKFQAVISRLTKEQREALRSGFGVPVQ